MTQTRRLGLLGATGIGVGSMLGAGVFSGMWVDVHGAGPWYLAAIAIAALVATANALSTAQLAARHPVAGGAYAYGRAELGDFAGRLAGTAFVVGKTASVGVGAAVLGTYVLPGHPQSVATAAIVVCWALNARGITRTAAGATAIAVVVSAVLVVLIVLGATAEQSFGWFSSAPLVANPADAGAGLPAVLTGASAAFFAFAGYARIATLGEEVVSPGRTIPRAIGLALAWVLVLYVGLAVVLSDLFDDRVAASSSGVGDDAGVVTAAAAEPTAVADAPIAVLASAVGMPVGLVTITAALAVGGAMLAVMAGAGRTAMAMARERDLPLALAHQGVHGAPVRAEAAIAVGAIALVWAPGIDLLLVSVATILTYYAVANIAAMAQRRAPRTATVRVPVAVSGAGLVGSLVLGAVALVGSSATVWPALVVALVVVGWPWVLRARGRRSTGA
ncbi:APC family permease [Demequina aestuarii]|uniref:APC family permease n=1 Tax=Demequina aestuarii TaxID=327095 RepID=UPI0007853B37|nr:APC family permease [Demequina aestuarii]